jgi:membrane protein required for colicin V production
MPDVKTIPEIAAFIVLFGIVFIIMKILEYLLKDIIEGIKLGGADRFLGLIFGFVEGLVVVSLVLFIIRIQPLFDPGALLSESFFAGAILPLIANMGNSAGV